MRHRIVIVGPLPPPVHGVTISTRRLLNSNMAREFDLVHLDTSDHRDVSTIGSLDFLNFYLAFKSYLQLILICFKFRPELVYVPISQSFMGFFRDAFYLVFPKLFFRSKIVIHLRGAHFGEFYSNSGYITKKLIDVVMKSVDRVIVLGESLRSIFHPWFADKNIDVAPNGTDLQIPGVENKIDHNIDPAGEINVSFMSSLMRSKGIIEFVSAACDVSTKFQTVTFLVAGEWWNQEPELKGEVEAIVKDHGKEDRIRFLGLVTGEAKVDFLKSTDIFVLPTYYPFEGHPNVIVEAMAAGCPVISTNHASIPETVIDGETGVILPVKDSKALADTISRFLNDSSLISQMARNSYERYLAHYTEKKSTAKIIDSFYSAIAN